MLAVMFAFMFGSILNESPVVDEAAHIPAGYSYVTLLDYRLNPEHPPLLKALAGLSVLLFVHPTFRTDVPHWQTGVNDQWYQGYVFFFQSGNDNDRIVFWARVPLLLLAVWFGWWLFAWIRRRFGAAPALLTLAFYCFSPTILAHARYVTTDFGATLGFFLGIATFIDFLEEPNWRRTAIAGLTFGCAQLLKFSLVLLVPVFVLITVLWWFVHRVPLRKPQLLGRIAAIFVIGLAVIWGTYAIFTWRYPQERQLSDTTSLLEKTAFRPMVDLEVALVEHALTRPLAHYLLGVLMVQQRAAEHAPAYFLGKMSLGGSHLYFPLLYLLKEPLPLHFLAAIALWYVVGRVRRLDSIRRSMAAHCVECSAALFVLLYWSVSITSPLNIGVRHVMPTFPFLYLLVSLGVCRWLRLSGVEKEAATGTPFPFFKKARELAKGSMKVGKGVRVPIFCVGLLLAWLVLGTAAVAPHFLSFYNELAGGSSEGWRIAVDSNYDWGQDLKRLKSFIDEQGIAHITTDYFGGGIAEYTLKDRMTPWTSKKGPAKGWFAISSTFRQWAFGVPTPGFVRRPEDSYEWLKPYTPVARVGYSIFVYKLPE